MRAPQVAMNPATHGRYEQLRWSNDGWQKAIATHSRGAEFGLRQSLDTIGGFLGPLRAVALMSWLWLAAAYPAGILADRIKREYGY